MLNVRVVVGSHVVVLPSGAKMAVIIELENGTYAPALVPCTLYLEAGTKVVVDQIRSTSSAFDYIVMRTNS